MYRSATSNLTTVENGNQWCQTRANNEAPSIGNVAPQKDKEVPAYSPTADKAELISGAIPAIINAIAAYAQYSKTLPSNKAVKEPGMPSPRM